MTLETVFLKALPVQTGQGAKGEWKKRNIIVKYQSGNFEKQIALVLWGDLVDKSDSYVGGQKLIVDLEVESREYNGKWYTDAKAWKIEALDAPSAPFSIGGKPDAHMPTGHVPNASFNPNEDDGLPF